MVGRVVVQMVVQVVILVLHSQLKLPVQQMQLQHVTGIPIPITPAHNAVVLNNQDLLPWFVQTWQLILNVWIKKHVKPKVPDVALLV